MTSIQRRNNVVCPAVTPTRYSVVFKIEAEYDVPDLGHIYSLLYIVGSPGFEFQILWLEGSAISFILPSSGCSPGLVYLCTKVPKTPLIN